jgi:hypothetical protein
MYMKSVTFVRNADMRGRFGFEEGFEKTNDVCRGTVVKNVRMILKETAHVPASYDKATLIAAGVDARYQRNVGRIGYRDLS